MKVFILSGAFLFALPFVLCHQTNGQDQCKVKLKDSLRKAFRETGGVEAMPLVNISATNCRKRSRQDRGWCVPDTNGRKVTLQGSAVESYIRNCDCEYDIELGSTDTLAASRGRVIGRLPQFGPEFKVRMIFTVKAMPVRDWASILHITYGDNQLDGARYPGLFLHQNGDLHFASYVNGDFNYARNFNGVRARQTYDVTIEQNLKSNGKLQYEAFVNKTQVVSVENTKSLTLEKGIVYFSDPWYDQADLKVSYLNIRYKIRNPESRIYEVTRSFSAQRSHQEVILSNYGPAFKIDMKFRLKGLPREGWANIFHISNGQNEGRGGRYPALFLNRGNFFHFTTCIDDNFNYQKNVGYLSQQLFDITIEQKFIQGKWKHQIFLDGQLLLSKDYSDPIVIENAKLYLSDPWYEAANVEFLYFRVEY